MVSISLLLYEECSSSFLAPSVWNNLPNEWTKTLHQFKCLMNIKLRNAFSTKSDRKITISIFTTRLLSSQQLMDFFFNFSYGSFFCFFLTSYAILVYQFLNSWDNIARVITLCMQCCPWRSWKFCTEKKSYSMLSLLNNTLGTTFLR